MRCFQFRSTNLILILAAFTFFGEGARAVVVMTDAQNVSGFDNRTLTAPIIYGGAEGPTPDDLNSNSLFNNCAGRTNLAACSEKRIHRNLILTISFKSDSQDGYPQLRIVDSDNNAEGVLITPISTPTSVNKNSIVTLAYKWEAICTAMKSAADASNGVTDITNTCDIEATSTNRGRSANFYVGFVGTSATSQDAMTDKVTLAFKVAGFPNDGDNDTATSVIDSCDDGVSGLCHFEVKAGDEKVGLSNIRGGSGFPNGSVIPFQYVRILRIEGNSPGSITPANAQIQDLEIADDSTDTTSDISLAPDRITGLTNDVTYSFKAAAMDWAGNVGYYTSNGDGDTYCVYSSQPDGNTCHIATPGEVVGVLSDQMNCFISTAAYGSPMAKQVGIFRAFRDQFLVPHAWGIKIMHYYYKYSPPVAEFIAQNEMLRTSARVALFPVLAYAWLSLKIGAGLSLIAMLALFASPFVLIHGWKKHQRERSVRDQSLQS